MIKLGVTKIDTNMTLYDAVRIIELKHDEKHLQREKVDKSQFPATKQTIKKLRDLRITFSENITRSQAKELISKHKDKEYLSEIFSFLKKNDVEFIKKLSIDIVFEGSDANSPTLDQLAELYTLAQGFFDSGIEINFPSSLNKNEMEIFNQRLSDAESEVDDIETQLTTFHKLAIGDHDFKVVGELPEEHLLKIYSHIIKKIISGEWNSDKDLKMLLKQHLPELSLKKINY